LSDFKKTEAYQQTL